MAKLSYGDLSINTQVNTVPSSEEMIEAMEKSYPSEENIKNNTNIKNAIPINKNQDGSLKYTFDNIYEDKELAEIAKDYYTNRDQQVYTNKEAVDKFIPNLTITKVEVIIIQGTELEHA